MAMWIWQNGLLDFRVKSLQILDGSFYLAKCGSTARVLWGLAN